MELWQLREAIKEGLDTESKEKERSWQQNTLIVKKLDQLLTLHELIARLLLLSVTASIVLIGFLLFARFTA